MRPGRPSRDDPTAPESPPWSDPAARDDALGARVESVDGREECTLFPLDAAGEDLVTTWVTATGDAFVDLADWR